MPSIKHIRNIGIIAHIDAGKTTLSERMLFYSRKIHRMGEVHNGSATMDYMPEEQERGITIMSACTTCQWGENTINLIDTPGHVDFTIEVERALRVLDGAVGVFCAVGGVEPQSETVWRQSEDFNVPKIAFINKIDRLGADFEAVLEAMRQRLQTNAVAVTIPLGQGEDFRAVLDLVNEQSLTFDPADQGQTVHRAPFTEEEAAIAAPWREILLEKLGEADDAFVEPYLEGTFTLADINAALRRATLARTLTPVFCGSALRNMGVQPVLDAVCALLPSPADVPAPVGHDADGREIIVEATPNAPAAALVFKVLMENGRKLAFVRMYAGRIREGESLRNTASGKDDRLGRIYRPHADRREQVESAEAGEIVVVVGLRGHTGETYTARERQLALESIDAYAPVITLALEPRNADEGKILDEALARYTEEDPTLLARLDDDTGSRMVSGMGELHLDVLLERMQREYGISPRAGNPQVVLRETVRKEAEAAAVFDREMGKERHQGSAALRVAPRARGTGNVVEVGDFLPQDAAEARKILPRVYLDAALEGVRDALQCGDLTGYPIEDVAVTLTAVDRQEGLTTVPGCRMAAGQALREALAAATPVVLEPVMRVEITVPEDFLGASITLFTTCGGKVEDMEDHGGRKTLRGAAPLRRLFGFSTSLRSATQGRAGLVMTFDRFDLP
ncbi:elongation factor G [Desulfovibrio desulfuricans]|uniref:elongation factor G n=1 Tax=Desulfovibrio desulfuricans TaxID=876 RepID=UPI00177B6D99|nr:elongation factor G [Desulfovibrio desulfuricans]MBD8895165.1 elongation factor G [Desulfovibrio desulfuricans]